MPTQPPIYGKWRTAHPGSRFDVTTVAGETRPIILVPDRGDTLSGITHVAYEIGGDEDDGPLLRKTNTDLSNPIELGVDDNITIPFVKGDTFTFTGRMRWTCWDETPGFEKVLASGWHTFIPNPDAAGTVPSPVPVTFPLPASGVDAGIYGDATHVPRITVSEAGVITDVEVVEITGGGGGGTGGVGKYSALIGDGVTSTFTIAQATHGLAASSAIEVVVRDASTGAEIDVQDAVVGTGNVTLYFGLPPTTNQFLVILIGENDTAGDVESYSAAIGDGVATTFAITQATHGLSGDANLLVRVRDTATGQEVGVENSVSGSGTVTLTFATAPTSGEFTVTILG